MELSYLRELLALMREFGATGIETGDLRVVLGPARAPEVVTSTAQGKIELDPPEDVDAILFAHETVTL